LGEKQNLQREISFEKEIFLQKKSGSSALLAQKIYVSETVKVSET
jgi:hypothetical protein